VSKSQQPDVSGDFKTRIHSPELLVGMDEVTTLISEIKETADATCPDEISMLGSATARQCDACHGTTKATQCSKTGTCPACMYGPLAIRNGCNSREDPPDRMQIQGVYVDGVLDETETNALKEDFYAAVTQTSIGRLAEGGAVLRASVVDGPVRNPVDEKGKAKLVGRRAQTILELSDPKVRVMTEVVRGFQPSGNPDIPPRWPKVEPREVICLEPDAAWHPLARGELRRKRYGTYIFIGQGEGASWCNNLKGKHDNCSVYWRFELLKSGYGRIVQQCFSDVSLVPRGSNPDACVPCGSYRSRSENFRQRDALILWPEQASSSAAVRPKVAAAAPAPAEPPAKRPTVSDALREFYLQLIAEHPDASEHLPETSMEPTDSGVRLTFDSSFDDLVANPDQTTTQVVVARDVEAVRSAIGDHILRHHGRAIERLCKRIGQWSVPGKEAAILRDEVSATRSIMWTGDQHQWVDDQQTLHLMACSGHFETLSTLHIGTSEISPEALSEFRERIERDVRNWPKLKELVAGDPAFPRKHTNLPIRRDAETEVGPPLKKQRSSTAAPAVDVSQHAAAPVASLAAAEAAAAEVCATEPDSLYSQLIEAHPDAEDHLPENNMVLTADGVTLTFGKARPPKQVPHPTVEAVWWAIVEYLRDKYGERMDTLCAKLGVTRDALNTLTTLDICRLKLDRYNVDTLQKMASCGYFVKVSTIKARTDGCDADAWEEFTGHISKCRANWPNLSPDNVVEVEESEEEEDAQEGEEAEGDDEGIVEYLREKNGERINMLCAKLGVTRDALSKLTTLDIRRLPLDSFNFFVLQEMASCGYFENVSTIKVCSNDRKLDEDAFWSFKEHILTCRANWPNLEPDYLVEKDESEDEEDAQEGEEAEGDDEEEGGE